MKQTIATRSTLAIAAGLFVLAVSTAAAHHGWTGYDETKTTTLTGTVKAMAYENPHSTADLEADGKVWRVVLAPPQRMQARGLPREMLKVGATATVVGYPHKTNSKELRAERITIGGKTTELR